MRNFKFAGGSGMGFRDLLFNLALLFAVLFIVAFLLISQEKKEDVERPAQYLITTTWDDYSSVDIDTHLWHDATKTHLNYVVQNQNHTFLERDDRGTASDRYVGPDGTLHTTYLNQEVITIREKVPGRYVINAHFYTPDNVQVIMNKVKWPFLVKVQILQLNPYRKIATEVLRFTEAKQELTAAIFDIEIIDGYPQVTNIDTDIQFPFVYRNLGKKTIDYTRNWEN